MKKHIKPIRLHFLIIIAFLKRRKELLLILPIVLIIAFLQYRFSFLNFKEAGVSEGMIGTYLEDDLPSEVTKLLSQGLIEADSNGHLNPKLAAGWQVNNDATVFTFRLKEDLYFTDGSKLKSSDLSFNIPDIEVSFPDESSIEFKLKEPFSPFPSLLTQPIFKKNSLVGVGPYQIEKIEKSRVFITKITLLPTKVDLPTVTVRFYPNEKTAITGFNLGEFQVLLGVNKLDIAEGKQISTRQFDDYTKIVTILYSTKDELLSNRSFRQVLSYAAPEIEGRVAAQGPFPPKFWAFAGDSKDYLANPAAAKLAMERAKSSSNPEFLKKELVLITTPQHEEVAKKVILAWREFGVNATIRVESGIPQNFQAMLITQSIPLDPDQYFLWHSTQSKTNLTKYDSKRVDKDLEDGRKTIKEEGRKIKYVDFQKALLEDSPATFLFYPKYNVVYLKKAENNLNKVLPLQVATY